MKFKEIKIKKDEELQRMLTEFSEKLRELHFKDANKQLSNVRDIRKVRKNIAQIKTLLKERQSK